MNLFAGRHINAYRRKDRKFESNLMNHDNSLDRSIYFDSRTFDK